MREALRALIMTLAAVLVAGSVLVACGEPPVDVDIPARSGRSVLDVADVLSEDVEDRFAAIRDEEDLDVVGLTYESPSASAGEARRAAQQLVAEWDADVALVAVAEQGGFGGAGGDRFFGLEPADQFAVPGSLRERIVGQDVVAIAAEDDWDRVFLSTAETLVEELP